MRRLVIACGNRLRGDDGVAARALELLGETAGVERRVVQQLTPELASDLAYCDLAVIVDAHPSAVAVRIAPVPEASAAPNVLSHAARAEDLVALARALYGWRGAAFTCALPVAKLAASEQLSHRAERSARAGVRALRRFLRVHA